MSAVTLTRVSVTDLPALYEAETQPHVVDHIWHGSTPPFERWADGVFLGAFVQALIRDQDSGDTLGRIKAYDASRENRWCYLTAIRYRAGSWPLRFIKGVVQFLEHLFRSFDTVYLDAGEGTLGQFRSFTRYLSGVGPYALTRETWERDGKRFMDWSSR